MEDLYEFKRRYITPGETVVVDIETFRTQVTTIGFAPGAGIGLVIPFVDFRRSGRSYWPSNRDEFAAWKFVKGVLEDDQISKCFQNGLYDISFLWRSVGIKVRGAEHDTMLLHHSLQPESLKGLGYLGSVYTDERAWKHMRSTTIKQDA